jgi:hypothetical protein
LGGASTTGAAATTGGNADDVDGAIVGVDGKDEVLPLEEGSTPGVDGSPVGKVIEAVRFLDLRVEMLDSTSSSSNFFLLIDREELRRARLEDASSMDVSREMDPRCVFFPLVVNTGGVATTVGVVSVVEITTGLVVVVSGITGLDDDID